MRGYSSLVRRKAIVTVSNRRDAEAHPEFLDTDMLLMRFEPLIKSIQRKFLSYNGIFNCQADSDELYSQIVLEFLRLRKSYDPRRGVDFTGFIKFHLQQRIYHWVMHYQSVQQWEHNETDTYIDDDDSDNYNSIITNTPDELSDYDQLVVEALSSLDRSLLSSKQNTLVDQILYKHMSDVDIARSRHTTITKVRGEITELCDLLSDTYHERYDNGE